MPSDSAEVRPNADVLASYRAVLQSQAEFIDEWGVGHTVERLNEVIGPGDVTVDVSRFTLLDLDDDDVPEMVLWLAMGENEYIGFEILRYEEGVVYGFCLYYRSFLALKGDGTFSFSGGASNHGFGTIRFDKGVYSIEEITYCESFYDDDGKHVTYYVNLEAATSDEFNAAIDEQDKKEGPMWLDFMSKNIDMLTTMSQ